MPKGIIALVMAFALAGCLATQHQQSERATEIKQAADAAYQACQSQYSELPKDAIARAKCINDAEATLKPVVNYPDLIDLKMAKRAELAEQMANGKITRTEATLEFSQFVTGLIDEVKNDHWLIGV